MAITIRNTDIDSPLAGELARLAETALVDCYQCGKCSAGCPVVDQMDIMPSRVIRLAQLGQYDKILRCETIWLCASCETCTTRCPREVDIAKVMDGLREMALARHVEHIRSHEIIAFHRAFLDTVWLFGRMQEFPLVGDYKMRSFKLFQDILAAPKMLLRGKLHFLPRPMKARKEIREIFRRCGY
jgi:heterodisulfide reductase subunit C